MLRDDAGIVIAEDALHLFAEGRRRNAEGKKKRGTQPNGRIESSDNTQNDEHARKVSARFRQAKL